MGSPLSLGALGGSGRRGPAPPSPWVFGRYLRGTIDETKQHEERVVLAEGRGDDGECVDYGDRDEHALAAERVRHGAPRVRTHHHTDEDYAVQPSLEQMRWLVSI